MEKCKSNDLRLLIAEFAEKARIYLNIREISLDCLAFLPKRPSIMLGSNTMNSSTSALLKRIFERLRGIAVSDTSRESIEQIEQDLLGLQKKLEENEKLLTRLNPDNLIQEYRLTIHDGPLLKVSRALQSLRALIKHLDIHIKEITLDTPQTIARLTSIESDLTRAQQTLRSLAESLPPIYDRSSETFNAELLQLAAELREGKEISIRFNTDRDLPQVIPGKLTNLIKAFLRTAVNNSVEHGSATEIVGEIRFDDHRCYVVVDDNGLGFDQIGPQESKLYSPTLFLRHSSSSGLGTIFEYLSTFSGELILQNKLASGAKVSMSAVVLVYKPGNEDE